MEFEAGGMRLVLRGLQQEELVQVSAFCAGVGWSISLEYIQALYRARPPAFVGAFNQDGTLISELYALLNVHHVTLTLQLLHNYCGIIQKTTDSVILLFY